MSDSNDIICTHLDIRIDYSNTLDGMIRDGKYDFVSENITNENFPIEGEGVIDLKAVLVYFDFYRNVSIGYVAEKMEQMNLAPARIEHLLALGTKYPNLQREHSITCLASLVKSDGKSYHLCLDSCDDERRVCLPLLKKCCCGRFFLAVNKQIL